MKNAVIVIPTYNESGNIESLIKKISAESAKISNWNIKILIVDSNSPDNTSKIVESMQKTHKNLHLLKTNREGLGKAYVRGFKYAIDKFQPYVLFEMDADLSHDSKKIPEFLKKIETGSDFVIGSRYIKNGSIPKDWGIHRKIFSIIGNLIVRFGFMKLAITDWTSGFRAVKIWVIKEALPTMSQYSGYVFQVALLDKALIKQARVHEVPINFTDRTVGVSKINSLQYIFQTLWYVLLHSSFIKYVIVGVIGFSIDFGISYLLIEKAKIIIWLATIISAELAIINNFFLNNFWSFSHKKIESNRLVYFSKFIKFNLIAVVSIIIQAGGIQILANTFGHSLWYLYKVCIIVFIIIPYSYFLYNKVVWKDK